MKNNNLLPRALYVMQAIPISLPAATFSLKSAQILWNTRSPKSKWLNYAFLNIRAVLAPDIGALLLG